MAKNSIRVREIPILLLSAKKEKIYKLEIILLAFKIELSRLQKFGSKLRIDVKIMTIADQLSFDGQSKFP